MNKRFALLIVAAMVLGVAVGWALSEELSNPGARDAPENENEES